MDRHKRAEIIQGLDLASQFVCFGEEFYETQGLVTFESDCVEPTGEPLMILRGVDDEDNEVEIRYTLETARNMADFIRVYCDQIEEAFRAGE